MPDARDDHDDATTGGEDRRLRALLDHLPAMIGYWDRDLRNVIANEAYVEWFGFTPEQMKGIHIREVLGERIYALNLPHIERVLAGADQLFERTIVDTHGATRHTQASYVPDVVDGEVCGFFVLVTDVTPRVEAQRLMDQAQRLAELGSWTLDPRTRRFAWSAQMFRIAGLDPDTVEPTFDLLVPMVHPEDHDRVLDRAMRSWRTARTTSSTTAWCARTATCARCTAGSTASGDRTGRSSASPGRCRT